MLVLKFTPDFVQTILSEYLSNEYMCLCAGSNTFTNSWKDPHQKFTWHIYANMYLEFATIEKRIVSYHGSLSLFQLSPFTHKITDNFRLQRYIRVSFLEWLVNHLTIN